MGFLDHLWDETLAGPNPDSSLGKHGKYKSLRLPSGPNMIVAGQSRTDVNLPSNILRTINNNNNISASGSTLSSPSGCTTPGSPFSPTSPGGNIKKLSRRKSMHSKEPKSPTGYDWIVLSALER
ncbi:dormancy-associated protein homolog 4-like [Rutidosis leptorrhynchoides]|uniref:dormancy-associated protein homolog 4-like n=1 Tax=Rutidosis leptorrhynchoides TaxID=125765 RepID=UPI003A9A50CA